MSANLELLQEKLADLSVKELLTLQEQITAHLRVKTEPLEKNGHAVQSSTPIKGEPSILDVLPSARLLTEEDIDIIINAMFTPEELAELEDIDIDAEEIPPFPKRMVEYISEDREDRI